MLEILTLKEAHQRGLTINNQIRISRPSEFNASNLESFGNGSIVMRFTGELARNKAYQFVAAFLKDYLIPKCGEEDAKRFPMSMYSPIGNIHEELCDLFTPPNPNRETWLIVPKDRFDEVKTYLESREDEMKD